MRYQPTSPLVFLLCDVYKTGHRYQQPVDTEYLFDNFTPRSAKRFPGGPVDTAVVLGLQRFVLKWLVAEFDAFFAGDIDVFCTQYERYTNAILGPGLVDSTHVRALHRLGYLPLRLRGLPEGSHCPIRVPMLSIENTHPEFAWLVGYFEDLWSNELWKPVTIATIAREYRKVFDEFAADTCDSNAHVDYQGHDFSLRGLSGMSDASNGNIGHLVYFRGTDSIPAIWGVDEYYLQPTGMGNTLAEIGNSIPATEHSVTCANIAQEMARHNFDPAQGEQAFLERLLVDVYPTGLFSFVADTNDYFDTITNKFANLKDLILARDGKVTVRPDSGDPERILCGYTCHPRHFKVLSEVYSELAEHDIANEIEETDHDYLYDAFLVGDQYYAWEDGSVFKEITYNELRGSLELLGDLFGTTLNGKGMRELNPHVGIIYGDSITLERARSILATMRSKGWASNNVIFGIGSFTYQFITRDSLGIAIKATGSTDATETYQLSKNPKTDDGTKKSAKGWFIVEHNGEGLALRDGLSRAEYQADVGGDLDAYQTYFEDGEYYTLSTFEAVRWRAKA